ncbi:L,D-transpeptidase family protein [Microvirga brassicacearum]|uniref:L,D-transpeptidase family protein n=1 Tax=Microvirga brassicacearum TaxID=2580413 RepID=UPI001FCF1EBC|nr:L,D-transpeptidase family protein [Microvirga brassicacearum]
MIRSLRKTVPVLGLIGSVSLFSLTAVVADEYPVLPDQLPILVEPAQPSFDDIASMPLPAPQDVAILPEPEPPAPVMINADDLSAPAPPIEIPLPDSDSALAAIKADWLRLAVEDRLADDAAMRELRLTGADRESLSAFYAASEQPLVWVRDGVWTPAAKAIVARLKAANEDGLVSTDYTLPDPGLAKDAAPAQWAHADLRLSASAILYARDARGGRIELSRISPLITAKLDLPQAGDVLARLSAAKDAGAVLVAYNPPHPTYQALRAELAKLRSNQPSQPTVRVPKGPILRVGMQDPRVPLIRAHFKIKQNGKDQNLYDERVATAVAEFQKAKGLPTNGVLNARTIAALSSQPRAVLESELISNMERWRWLPADLGARHIMVNVPEYRLRLVERGDVVHETRVIVGKEQTQTPIFSENMKYLVVNPSWTLPPSIIKKEFLPALAADPDYAARKGYRVIRKGNRISVQQPPGARNALGLIKFMFPNDHAVYLHDTPNRNLFSAGKRAFSHGCVRVDQPFQLAEEILGQDDKWSEKTLRGLVGKGERYVHLKRPLPVHLTYFTLSVDENGALKSFDDLYGFDRKVRAALGLPS